MNPLDPNDIVVTLGTLGVLVALFVETGLLVGLLLPGDSLLFIAGFASSEAAKEILGRQLSYTQLIIWAPIFATAGSQFGFWLGNKYGKQLFDRPDSKYFNSRRVLQAEQWLMKYGLGKALIFSHFIPFVRTLLNPLCGILGISAKKFLLWNLVGSYIWTLGIISAGYFLGESLQHKIDNYLMSIITLIIVISLLPLVFELVQRRERKIKEEDR